MKSQSLNLRPRTSLALIMGVILGMFGNALSAQAGDKAFGFGISGGVHGGGMNHFKTTLNGTTDPIKEGLVGIDYGYQFGVDLQLSVLWIKAMYVNSNYWITDWKADPTGNTDRRYSNSTIFTPLMFKVKETANLAGAMGVYYALPLTTSDIRDWGLAIGFRGHAGSPKFFYDLLMTGGFVEQGFGAQNLNFILGAGYQL